MDDGQRIVGSLGWISLIGLFISMVGDKGLSIITGVTSVFLDFSVFR